MRLIRVTDSEVCPGGLDRQDDNLDVAFPPDGGGRPCGLAAHYYITGKISLSTQFRVYVEIGGYYPDRSPHPTVKHENLVDRPAGMGLGPVAVPARHCQGPS